MMNDTTVKPGDVCDLKPELALFARYHRQLMMGTHPIDERFHVQVAFVVASLDHVMWPKMHLIMTPDHVAWTCFHDWRRSAA